MVNGLQSFVNGINEATRMESGKEYNLGRLIEDLEKQPGELEIVVKRGKVPICFDSYRGYYNRLSIDYEDRKSMKTPTLVEEFLRMAKNANGKTFTGYKGGDFVMDKQTPIYVSNYGEAEGLKVVGIKKVKDKVVIKTRYEE